MYHMVGMVWMWLHVSSCMLQPAACSAACRKQGQVNKVCVNLKICQGLLLQLSWNKVCPRPLMTHSLLDNLIKPYCWFCTAHLPAYTLTDACTLTAVCFSPDWCMSDLWLLQTEHLIIFSPAGLQQLKPQPGLLRQVLQPCYQHPCPSHHCKVATSQSLIPIGKDTENIMFASVMGSGSEFRRLFRIRIFCENGSEMTQKFCF